MEFGWSRAGFFVTDGRKFYTLYTDGTWVETPERDQAWAKECLERQQLAVKSTVVDKKAEA